MINLNVTIERKHLYGLGAIVALAILIYPIGAWATGTFTDVSDSNVYRADIEWLADAGITKGCNPPVNDKFCPSSNVNREQMAAFMHRLAVNQVVDAGTVQGYTAEELQSSLDVFVVTRSYIASAGHSGYDATLQCEDGEHGDGVVLSGGYRFDDPDSFAVESRPAGSNDVLNPMYPLPNGWRVTMSHDPAVEVAIDMWVVCYDPTP